ncbi:MAG: glycosyltransferase [Candidatus Krumholzibacteriia bacterium]
MKLSVVIPTLDKRPLLERTLAALLSQDAGTAEWEVVVVDDGSTDDTAALLARLAAADGRVRPVSPPRNVGRARARNLGWRAASGRWVLFLDDDILAPPGLLRAHLAVLAAGEAVGTIGPTRTAPEILDAAHFHYIDTRGVAKLPAGPAPGKYLVTQNAAVPREALAAVGGFDEGYAAYGFEDMDLGFCLEDAGVRFQVLPAPVPLHIHHHDLAAYLQKKRLCGRSSLRRLAARHPHRLREMRLDGLLAGDRPSSLARVLGGRLGVLPAFLAASWPAAATSPILPAAHARCLDLAVLCCYAAGLTAPRLDS